MAFNLSCYAKALEVAEKVIALLLLLLYPLASNIPALFLLLEVW
jgi:hypothetical protein